MTIIDWSHGHDDNISKDTCWYSTKHDRWAVTLSRRRKSIGVGKAHSETTVATTAALLHSLREGLRACLTHLSGEMGDILQRERFPTLRKFAPANLALVPNSSSIRSSWLYFARRSDLFNILSVILCNVHPLIKVDLPTGSKQVYWIETCKERQSWSGLFQVRRQGLR